MAVNKNGIAFLGYGMIGRVITAAYASAKTNYWKKVAS